MLLTKLQRNTRFEPGEPVEAEPEAELEHNKTQYHIPALWLRGVWGNWRRKESPREPGPVMSKGYAIVSG